MEQQYQTRSSVDYSLKEGQTLKLKLKNVILNDSFSAFHISVCELHIALFM
jgi:hypothetical protein